MNKSLHRRAVFVLTALVLGVAAAGAEPTTTIVNNGRPLNRVDIVVLGDGYTAAELPKYAADVRAFVAGAFAQRPFSNYRSYFNVRRIDVVSDESGADHPNRSVFKRTALHSTYDCAGIQHLICLDTASVDDVLLRSVGPHQRDIVIVLVNDSEYGGSGGSVAVASLHTDALELVLHEMGHSFGLLADEYADGGLPCEASFEPPEPNVTIQTDRGSIKWDAWIEPDTPLPTPTFGPAEPGLYEGARYCAAGVYRATYDSKMRTLGMPYEQVNTEQLIKRVYNLVSPIDEAAPASQTLTAGPDQSISFRIQTPRPVGHSIRVLWEIDGNPAGTTRTLAVATRNLSIGEHVVRVIAVDPTAMVRNDPDQLLLDVHTWTLHIVALTPPDIQVVTPNGGEVLTAGVPVTVRWTAADPDGLTRFDVAVSTDGGPFATIPGCGALAGRRRTCAWSAPGPASASVLLRVTARDARGASAADTSDVPFTIEPAQLPGRWRADDVGNVGRRGTSSGLDGAFTLNAGGAALWSTIDAFHFVHQSLTGDGDLIARIATLVQPGDAEAAMAGVMFRSSLSPDAPHASMLVSTVGKAKFRRRLTAGGITHSDGPATGSTSVPQWLKVSRRGNTFTAYLSDDGATWTLVHAPVTVEMPETIAVGLFASRVGGASLTTARLTDVQLVRD